MTREEARELVEYYKRQAKTFCEMLDAVEEILQKNEELQATIDCLEWTIEQLSHSKPKEIANAV